MIDGFIKEMGYNEALKVCGLPQSDITQNEIENFLREMGYID
jgi:hypothetical protein